MRIPTEYDLDAGLCKDLIEQQRELRVPIPDKILDCGPGIFEIHDQVSYRLCDPSSGGVGGGAQHTDSPGGVLDDDQDVLALSGQCDGLDEVARQQRVGLAAQESGPGGGRAFGCRVDALVLEDLPDGRGRDLDAQDGQFAGDSAITTTRVLTNQAQYQPVARLRLVTRPDLG